MFVNLWTVDSVDFIVACIVAFVVHGDGAFANYAGGVAVRSDVGLRVGNTEVSADGSKERMA